jgi:hypothetical protein
MGKFQRFGMQLVWCQNIGNFFQNFGKTTFSSLANSKPITNFGYLAKILAYPNNGTPTFALKLAWQRLVLNQSGSMIRSHDRFGDLIIVID